MRTQYKVLQEKYDVLYESDLTPRISEVINMMLADTFQEFFERSYNFIKKNIKYKVDKEGTVLPWKSQALVRHLNATLKFLESNKFYNALEADPDLRSNFHMRSGYHLMNYYFPYFAATVYIIEQYIRGELDWEYTFTKRKPQLKNSRDSWLRGKKQMAREYWQNMYGPGKFYNNYTKIIKPVLADFIINFPKIQAAQTQHTSTHGVDLSNLEENIDHYPANSSNNFFDVVKNAPDKNQFIDWLINKSNLAHDLQDARDNYMEPEFTASLSKKRANWMIVNVYYDAVLENRQYECEEFSDNPIECIEKEKERIKKEILDYYDQYKAYLAQIKHTGTHGVDLSAL